MSLLNLAVSYLSPGEIYCEVGSFQGRSLVGALKDHPEILAYAIDDFSDFDPFQDNFDLLIENLSNCGLSDQVTFYYQNFEDFFIDLRTSQDKPTIGVYFYDAAYDYRSVLMGLHLVKPFLADQALIIVAASNWASVQQASQDFLLTTPECDLAWLSPMPVLSEAIYPGHNFMIFQWQRYRASDSRNLAASGQHQQKIITGITNLEQDAKQKVMMRLYAEALTYHHAHQFQAAIAKYREALYWTPDHPSLWRDLGMAYYLNQDYESAISMLNLALALAPDQSLLHYNLGLVFEAIGDTQQAIAAYQQAIVLDNTNVLACNNLGNLFMQAEKLDKAEVMFRRAIAIDSKFFGSYLNLGNVLTLRGDIEAAIKTYQTAISLKHDNPDVHYNLAVAYQHNNEQLLAERYFGNASFYAKEYETAIHHYTSYLKHYTSYLKSEKEDLDVYLVLAQCYQQVKQFESAVQLYEEAVKRYSQSLPLYVHWIYTLQNISEPERAIAVAQEASECLPAVLYLKAESLLTLPIIYNTAEELAKYQEQIIQGLNQLPNYLDLDTSEGRESALTLPQLKNNFYVIYQNHNDQQIQRQWSNLIHEILKAHYPFWCQRREMPPIDSEQKIRVGYIFANISTQGVVSKLFLNWLKYHDRDRFKVYCFQINPQPDFVSEAFRLYSDVFLQFPSDLNTICQKVIEQDLHILVFLEVGMDLIISQLSVLRLAPIQCVSWGHPITTGSPTIDYFLSNELMELPNAEQHYSEKLIRLPNLGIHCSPPDVTPKSLKTRQEYGLPSEAIIYLCIQSLQKYLPQYDWLFAAIAQRIPQAKFVFIESHISPEITRKLQQRLQRSFADQGLNADDYVVFLPREIYQNYFNFYRLADIFLDTFEFSGCLTTLDSLAYDLPIVTCPGQLMRGRQSYGILTRIGVTETIANNAAEYIDIAVRLGLEPEWRQQISEKINRNKSRLYDDPEPLQALENFYQQVVHEALAQQISVSDIEAASEANPDRKLLLHVGCGAADINKLPQQFRSPEWQEIRLDIDPSVHPDLLGSITDLSAVASNSVDAVYSSHNLEHVYHHEVPIALSEFYRVLKPGGFVLITLPDLQRVAEYVAQGKLEEPLYVSAAGPIAAIDILYGYSYDIARGNSYMAHRTGFTAKTLAEKLKQAGFSTVEVIEDDLNLWATATK
ncbi:tetratricopeptide repeat protein [Trichothermofontia sichuanensis B231]|uniref:tetratricopeptide repeat protein n=1 Tax=Trichothermofontia sichuanensis TaxID=3045816 RepID=UPI002245136C|nr:tetratricopeptide repeat protein [Trichothermofontia sichuanensis]UZQ55026.1 tetratricopeptide repeat protein [Trichothermofontia sichuanensis B231]